MRQGGNNGRKEKDDGRLQEYGVADREQLAEINRYARRPLEREELFVFSVILCDNEVDREFDQFPAESLERLGELFLGCTGVFDHAAKAENQSARIFRTKVERRQRTNSLGEPYSRLKAWAYMLRSGKNQDLILEIDGGIKKEVSVSCNVELALCSICGQDQRTERCDHRKGRDYDSQICYHMLVNPTDAYEWSFVAVPAQKNAGVTKGMGSGPEQLGECRLEKLFESAGDLTITGKQRAALAAQYRRLEKLAAQGEAYLRDLTEDAVRWTLLAQPDLGGEIIRKMVEGLDTQGLKSVTEAMRRGAHRRYPLEPQLGKARENTEPDRRFQV